MNRILIAICSLIIVTAFKATALSQEIEVTQKNIDSQSLSFNVTSSQSVSEPNTLYFTITVRKGNTKISPFNNATLEVKNGKEDLVVRCDLAKEDEDGALI